MSFLGNKKRKPKFRNDEVTMNEYDVMMTEDEAMMGKDGVMMKKGESMMKNNRGGMKKIKKVSVIIPNYNYGKYIKKRIKSVIEQTYPIYEIIVLDDRSTDGSEVIAKDMVLDLKLKNPEMKIQFLQNEENSGKAISQWRKGFQLARGEFVWIAEADDLCSPRFLEEVMKGFRDSSVVLSYAESRIINGRGLIIAPNFRFSRDREKQGHYKRNYVRDGEEEIREIMAIRCTIPNVSSVVFRKAGEIPYNEYLEEALKFKQVGDWYFYTKVLEHGRIAYNRQALNYFRVHRGSVTGQSKKGSAHYREVLKMHEYFRDNYEISEEVLGFMKVEEERIREKYGGRG